LLELVLGFIRFKYKQIRLLVPWVLAALALAQPAAAETGLDGTVVDAETGRPVAYVTITLDKSIQVYTARDGVFDFGAVESGPHTLVFQHVSYKPLSVSFLWPGENVPKTVRLEPSQFTTEKIVVKGKQSAPSLPVSAISLTRENVTMAAGNVANDPLRTIQAQPSCAIDGIDFLSKMAVRGGDSEEHRVYYDGYPLQHYAHVGGFAGVVYDDMLRSIVLVPGAAPIQYKGSLSGVVLMKPARPDTSFRSFRYDITSMAGGLGQAITPDLSFQVSAKTDFFNLPVYQQQGVKDRSFHDLMGRLSWSPRKSFTATATILAASDSETRKELYASAGTTRDVNSKLAGLDLAYRRAGWQFKLRPVYSYYDSRDAISWQSSERTHELRDTRLYGSIERQGKILGFGLSGDAGLLRHSGSGGDLTDQPYSASAQVRLLYKDYAALVLGGGGTREPWTADLEPEAYASLRIGLGNLVSISGGVRRSFQTPFVFSERRYFASLPIDAGDLLTGYRPTWEQARAVRMDQVSVEATLSLPLQCSIAVNGFERRYHNLLTWEWDPFPAIGAVQSNGDGRGIGYELVFARNANVFSFMVAASRARVWKTEGTLDGERIGDFDRPDSWNAGISVKVSEDTRISVRWTDVYGRPYTMYNNTSAPPATAEINAVRLPRFRRLDVKVVWSFLHGPFGGEFFVDIVNFRNEQNIAAMYALEVRPGTFTSYPYGGTRFFPIGGITLRW
jgi:hypothetical protein